MYRNTETKETWNRLRVSSVDTSTARDFSVYYSRIDSKQRAAFGTLNLKLKIQVRTLRDIYTHTWTCRGNVQQMDSLE